VALILADGLYSASVFGAHASERRLAALAVIFSMICLGAAGFHFYNSYVFLNNVYRRDDPYRKVAERNLRKLKVSSSDVPCSSSKQNGSTGEVASDQPGTDARGGED
jgi:hypothetical protein